MPYIVKNAFGNFVYYEMEFLFFTVAFEKFGRVQLETQVNRVSRGRGLSQGTVPDFSWVG